MSLPHLVDTLELERLEVNLFRGTTPEMLRERIYGGQVIAQSLLAAYETVEDRVCHSLHCYFIRGGDPKVPIIFEVDRARDGGSFTTRRVIAVQHGQQIFNLAASFQKPEDGFEHQSPAPSAPPPETQPAWEVMKNVLLAEPDKLWLPIEVRSVGAHYDSISHTKGEPGQQMWFRARSPIGSDPRMHQVTMAYASDLGLLGAALRPHGIGPDTPQAQIASLDHAMWFHQPSDFNQWHLFVQESPSASGGRGLVYGAIYREDGTLVASCAQEGLIRLRS